MGRPAKNKPGTKIGYLTIVEDSGKRAPGGNIIWKCQCDCGNYTYVSSGDLNRRNKMKSCGCKTYLYTRHPKDLTNQKFGILTAMKPTERRAKDKAIIWECKCDCGNITYVKSSHLIDGRTQSCGCIHSQGEYKIKNILSQLNISYEQQKSFIDCINPKTGYRLFFDFYLPQYDVLIEYDGQQHFEETDIFTSTLADNQYRDSIKDQYCDRKDTPTLIRIKYTEFNKINSDFILNLLKEVN